MSKTLVQEMGLTIENADESTVFTAFNGAKNQSYGTVNLGLYVDRNLYEIQFSVIKMLNHIIIGDPTISFLSLSLINGEFITPNGVLLSESRLLVSSIRRSPYSPHEIAVKVKFKLQCQTHYQTSRSQVQTSRSFSRSSLKVTVQGQTH